MALFSMHVTELLIAL